MSSLVPYQDARSLILAANVIPPERIAFANEPFSEPSGEIWMSVDAYSPYVDILDIGARNYEESGTIRILLIAPVMSGTDEIRQLASDVTDIFRNLGPRNPYYLALSIGEGGMDENGNWYSMPVSVDFKYSTHL